MEKENVHIDGVSVEVTPNIKIKKPRVKKEKIIPVSPKMTNTHSEFFGSKPILVKWKHWMLMCDIIKRSETFNKIYAKETFKYGDLEDTAAVIKAVYTKEPQEIKNLEGKVIETIPGIYNEEETWVLPPKFTFPTYRRYFLSHPELSWYVNESTPTLTKFQGYDFNMKFGPRPEQADLAEMAGNALRTQKYFKGIVQAAPGWGKATINSTLIPTSEGFIEMGKIEVGMNVFDRKGKHTKVTGVFPQGSIPVWEVKFDDGTSTKCNSEHLWGINCGVVLNERGEELLKHTKAPLEVKTTKDIQTLLRSGKFVEVPICNSLSMQDRKILGVTGNHKQNCRALGYFVHEHDGCIEIHRRHKRIVSVEELGYNEEQTCIMVDNEEHLYLTENFTVTHNTYISINIGSQTNGQMMVIVPNNLLAGQWHKSLLEFTDLTEDDIGMIKGSDLAKLKRQGQNKKPVMICLIQSLDSQLQRGDFEELVDFYKDTAAVFYDETHTSGAADGYAKTSGVFSTYNIIGLSATPYKKDKNLFQLYTGIGQIVYISTHQNLIPSCNMHLLDVPISQKEERNLFDIYQKTNYNFFMSQLEDFLFKVDAYFTYLAEWLIYRHKQGYSSVVLFKTNKMLDKLQLFLDKLRGDLEIKSTILTNVTAKNNRKELASSNVILSNYKMFSAGADYPFLSCIFFASMILGKTPIIQSLGRVTRKHDTKIQEVQAHFLIPKFIYPMYTNNEPHLNIVRSVKLQYPEAQFKWDNGFTRYFEEKKKASKNLNANDLSNFQANQTVNGQLPPPNPKGDFIVNGNYGSTNRLDIYRQQQIQSNNSGTPMRPQSYLPQ